MKLNSQQKYKLIGHSIFVIGGLTSYFAMNEPPGYLAIGVLGLAISFFGEAVANRGDDWFDWF